eukprot:g48928.t1
MARQGVAGSMLGAKDLVALLSLIEEKAPFDALATKFNKLFPKQQFKAASVLAIVLEDDALDLLELPARLTACFILHNLYSNEPVHSNPFLATMLGCIDKIERVARHEQELDGKESSLSAERRVERALLIELLTGSQGKEIGRKTPAVWISMAQADPARLKPDPWSLEEALGPLRESVEQKQPQPTTAGFASIGLAKRVADRGAVGSLSSETEPAGRSAAEFDPADLAFKTFQPAFVRLPPPIMLGLPREVIWLEGDPLSEPRLLWDHRMCMSSGRGGPVRELLAKALKDTLSNTERQKFKEVLRGDPKSVFHCGITPKKLPALVEKNPQLAIEVLLKLMVSTQITEYFSVLVNMEMTLHSLEVVNRLINAVELPAEFVNHYISNSIRSCQNVQDKYQQTRLVRLLCVFLQSLIHKKIINVKDLYAEVQSFCIEFSRIREAAGLFRLLKNLESDS